MVFILRFAFLLLFFCFEVHEASRAKSIRVCEGQRPFNHSCAMDWRIVSLETHNFLWNAPQGSAPNVSVVNCNHSLTQRRKRRKRRQIKAGAVKSSAPFQRRQRPELHRFIRTARYQVQSFRKAYKFQPPHVAFMTAESVKWGARSSIPNLDRAICAA